MNKTDSTDLTNSIKSLLLMMKNNCSEDSETSEDEDYFISSDETCSENEDNDDYSDLSETEDSSNEDCYSTALRLTKFFQDHVENTEKQSVLNSHNDEFSDIQFEEKMYRVIPLKLDEKVFKSKSSAAPKKLRT